MIAWGIRLTNRALKTGTWGRSGIAAAAALFCAFPAIAATPAGTGIVNTATLTFNGERSNVALQSNTVSLQTATLLDVTVAADRDAVTAAAGTNALGFVVANPGNSAQDYAIAAAGIAGT